jgi:hypothetical protein
LRKRLSTTIVLAVAASLALSACSGGGGGGGDKLDANKTPLTEYYEAMYGGYDEKEQIAKQKESEELVAVCMSKEGFEYTPVDQSQYMQFSEEDMEDRNTEKWVAANGYGMTLSPEEQEKQNEQSEQFVDPNQPYVEALSPGEQTAYYEVLYGPGPTEEEMAAMEDGEGGFEYNWETAGCQGAAQHEINGEDVTQSDKYKPLMDELNTVWEKVQKDPKITKLDAGWSACMADAGFSDLKKKEDAMTLVNEASNAYYETLTDAPDDAKLAELRENEIAVALADFKCGEKLDYQDTMLAVQFDVERQFIDDHKSELDAMIADVEQGK